MKKLLPCIMLFGFMFTQQIASAQFWLDIAGKGGVGLGGYYQSNLWNDKNHNNKFNLSYSYGGRIGLNFGEHNGLMLEGIINNNQQEFLHKVGDLRVPNVTNWQTLDLWALYRFNNTGSYLEIGPGMSMLRSIEQTYNALPLETQGFYNDQLYSLAGGFGGFIAGSNVFTLIAGIRLGYTFTDMMNKSAVENLPMAPPAPYASFDKYAAISPFFAQFTLELSFGIGGVAMAQCGRRNYLFGSRYR
jgi:hypothetical protein